MKKSKFSESQIVNILKEAEAGVSLEELVRQHGFSKASFYKWKAKSCRQHMAQGAFPTSTDPHHDQPEWRLSHSQFSRCWVCSSNKCVLAGSMCR